MQSNVEMASNGQDKRLCKYIMKFSGERGVAQCGKYGKFHRDLFILLS